MCSTDPSRKDHCVTSDISEHLSIVVFGQMKSKDRIDLAKLLETLRIKHGERFAEVYLDLETMLSLKAGQSNGYRNHQFSVCTDHSHLETRKMEKQKILLEQILCINMALMVGGS